MCGLGLCGKPRRLRCRLDMRCLLEVRCAVLRAGVGRAAMELLLPACAHIHRFLQVPIPTYALPSSLYFPTYAPDTSPPARYLPRLPMPLYALASLLLSYALTLTRYMFATFGSLPCCLRVRSPSEMRARDVSN